MKIILLVLTLCTSLKALAQESPWYVFDSDSCAEGAGPGMQTLLSEKSVEHRYRLSEDRVYLIEQRMIEGQPQEFRYKLQRVGVTFPKAKRDGEFIHASVEGNLDQDQKYVFLAMPQEIQIDVDYFFVHVSQDATQIAIVRGAASNPQCSGVLVSALKLETPVATEPL